MFATQSHKSDHNVTISDHKFYMKSSQIHVKSPHPPRQSVSLMVSPVGNENFAEKLRALVGAADAWRVTHYQDRLRTAADLLGESSNMAGICSINIYQLGIPPKIINCNPR